MVCTERHVVRFSAGALYFSCLPNLQDGSRFHPTSSSMGPKFLSPGVKDPNCAITSISWCVQTEFCQAYSYNEISYVLPTSRLLIQVVSRIRFEFAAGFVSLLSNSIYIKGSGQNGSPFQLEDCDSDFEYSLGEEIEDVCVYLYILNILIQTFVCENKFYKSRKLKFLGCVVI